MSEPAPPCTHRPPCPGCPRYLVPGPAPQAQQALEALAQEAGVALEPAVTGDPFEHRHRARLMVRGRVGSPKIGLFQQGTHRIVDIPACRVHHRLLNTAAAALKRAIRASGCPPYADAPHRGLVRALQGVVERESQTLQAVVVVNDDTPASTSALLESFAEELGEALHSLWWNGNPERTNTILGPHWHSMTGPASVSETIGGARVYFPPGAFGQSHLALADRLVCAVQACVEPSARVAEFHAGCGAIGLGLAARGHEVRFNEIAESSLEGLALGIAALGTSAGRASLHPGAAGEQLGLVDDCEVAIVDPPRRGLESALLERLRDAPPERLIYVACGLPSFLRDARTLLGGGRLALTRATPYDLFPFTEHVETLAVFDRRRSS